MGYLVRFAFIIGAAAFFAGCGGSNSLIGAIGTTPQSGAVGVHPRTGESSMPVHAYARSLLYVNLNSVNLYTYPRGKPVGSLGINGYLCSDEVGNVVLAGAAGVNQVWVFPHGRSQPIANMYNPANSGGCSVDPSSEKIAVAGGFTSLVTWPYNAKKGWGLAHQLVDPDMWSSRYCTYDPHGNLFLDGYTSSNSFLLAELPKGSSKFSTVTLDQTIYKPGSMQWAGKYLVIEDAGQSTSSPAVIYRFSVNGSSAHEVSATTLTDSMGYFPVLIHGRTAIGTMSYSSTRGLGFWKFPAGGAPVKILSTYISPDGEALSLK